MPEGSDLVLRIKKSLRHTELRPPASPEQIDLAESQLGFRLPPLLRRIFEEVADGGFGPASGIFPIEAGSSAPGQDRAIVMNWSCLDCRSADGVRGRSDRHGDLLLPAALVPAAPA